MRTVAGVVFLSCVVVVLCHDNHDHSYHQPAYNNPEPEPAPVAEPEPAPASVDGCTCFRRGNYYSVRSADKCGSFMQRTAFLPAATQYCPAGLQFDLKLCVCNYPQNTVCPYNCPVSYQAPANSKGTCRQNGNIYAVKPGTYCASFTQATHVLPPQLHHCPAGLMFDLKTCVCNWPAFTNCHH